LLQNVALFYQNGKNILIERAP